MKTSRRGSFRIAAALSFGAGACAADSPVEVERADQIVVTPNFDTVAQIGQLYSIFSLGDCERDPRSWATDSGGAYSIETKTAVDSSTLLGLVSDYTESGSPIIEDGVIVKRSLGSITLVPLVGQEVELRTEEQAASVRLPTGLGNTILVEPYVNNQQRMGPGLDYRPDHPLVVTIQCGPR